MGGWVPSKNLVSSDRLVVRESVGLGQRGSDNYLTTTVSMKYDCLLHILDLVFLLGSMPHPLVNDALVNVRQFLLCSVGSEYGMMRSRLGILQRVSCIYV